MWITIWIRIRMDPLINYVNLFQFFVIKTLDPHPQLEKMLDPDPQLEKNAGSGSALNQCSCKLKQK
jgi:hypothetical protein